MSKINGCSKCGSPFLVGDEVVQIHANGELGRHGLISRRDTIKDSSRVFRLPDHEVYTVAWLDKSKGQSILSAGMIVHRKDVEVAT